MLALQGAFAAHQEVLTRLGVPSVAIRQPQHLDSCDAIIIPGGESTTISKLAVTFGLFDPILDRLAAGMAAFGTCAGAIMLGTAVLDGRADQRHWDRIDMVVRRNGYGRQIDSFETEIEVDGLDVPFHGVFIRAPILETVGPQVEILASVGENPVLVRQGTVMAATFHPELSGDDRIHELFVSSLDPSLDPNPKQGRPEAASGASNRQKPE